MAFIVTGVLATGCHAHEVLFFGNSFTFGGNERPVEALGGVPAMVGAIARSHGVEVETRMLAEGGKDWSFHLAREVTDDALRERAWSHVVIQDFSTRPTKAGNLVGFLEDGERFYRRIRELTPTAKVVLYQTWARSPGHSIFAETAELEDSADMDRQLLEAYHALETKLEDLEPGEQVLRAPVGTAFARHLRREPEAKIYGMDLYHASEQGSYLAALVITGVVAGIDPLHAPREFGGVAIPEAEARALRETAAELAGPNALPMRAGLRPSFPFRVWLSGGDMATHAPMFPNATLEISGRIDPRALDAMGKTSLQPAGGARGEHPATAEFPFPFRSAGRVVRPGDPETAEPRERSARFIARWGNAPVDEPADLFLVQGGWGEWQAALEKMAAFEARGLIRKTVLALGPITEGVGRPADEALWKSRLEEIRARFPASPGVAFVVPEAINSPEYRELVAMCDRLSGELWPALPLPDGIYSLAPQSDPRLRLADAADGGARVIAAEETGRRLWRIERIRDDVYRVRPASDPGKMLAVSPDGVALADAGPDAAGEWVLAAGENGYRISPVASRDRAVMVTGDPPDLAIGSGEGRETVWSLVPEVPPPGIDW